jgi:hypothetical protein
MHLKNFVVGYQLVMVLKFFNRVHFYTIEKKIFPVLEDENFFCFTKCSSMF